MEHAILVGLACFIIYPLKDNWTTLHLQTVLNIVL